MYFLGVGNKTPLISKRFANTSNFQFFYLAFGYWMVSLHLLYLKLVVFFLGGDVVSNAIIQQQQMAPKKKLSYYRAKGGPLRIRRVHHEMVHK